MTPISIECPPARGAVGAVLSCFIGTAFIRPEPEQRVYWTKVWAKVRLKLARIRQSKEIGSEIDFIEVREELIEIISRAISDNSPARAQRESILLSSPALPFVRGRVLVDGR